MLVRGSRWAPQAGELLGHHAFSTGLQGGGPDDDLLRQMPNVWLLWRWVEADLLMEMLAVAVEMQEMPVNLPIFSSTAWFWATSSRVGQTHSACGSL